MTLDLSKLTSGIFIKIDRRKIARAYDWALITVAPAMLMYLLSDKTVVTWLTEHGQWTLPALGLLNIILNRLPKASEDEEAS
jgi:hypothetical protein